MREIRTRLRRWGNSFGVVVPQNVVESENIREGDDVRIFFNKRKTNILREMFGTFKFKRPVEDLLREADQELWGE